MKQILALLAASCAFSAVLVCDNGSTFSIRRELVEDKMGSATIAGAVDVDRAESAAPLDTGSLRIDFAVRKNVEVFVALTSDSGVEQSEWHSIMNDPLTKPELRNTRLDLHDLKPGRKDLIVTNGYGFTLDMREISIESGKETCVSVQISSSVYEPMTTIHGRVVDLNGNPIASAEVCLRRENADLCLTNCANTYIISRKTRGGGGMRWNGYLGTADCAGEDDCYSEAYLKSVLVPSESPACLQLSQYEIWSDGRLLVSTTTNEGGEFQFNLPHGVQVSVVAKYRDIEKSAAILQDAQNEIILPFSQNASKSFETRFEEAMRAMLFKDMGIFTVICGRLESARGVESLDMNEIAAGFRRLTESHFDFYSRDLEERNEFISAARRTAFDVALALMRYEEEPAQ